jgi:hypothetical protein
MIFTSLLWAIFRNISLEIFPPLFLSFNPEDETTEHSSSQNN